MIPYQVDVPLQRWPYANWALIALTTIVSFAWLADPGRGMLLSVEYFKPYQPLTAAFVHAGFWHLFGNMLFLFVFGNAVNAKIGHLPYLGLYVFFAYVSGIAWLLLPGGAEYSLGASGAVMGVAGMFLLYYPLNQVSVFTLIIYYPVVFHLSSAWLLVIFFLLDILGVLSAGGAVAHISHVAGFAAGAGLASVLLLRGVVRPGRGERCLLEVLGIDVAREFPQ